MRQERRAKLTPPRFRDRGTSALLLSRMSILWVGLLAAACSTPPPPSPTSPPSNKPVTLVITGTRVWTGNPDQPWAEAVAAAGETIVAVGSASEVAPLIGDGTEVVSVAGSMLVPGFIDTHVHFLAGGSSLASVQLRDARTPEEFTNRIADFAKSVAPGEWILNGAWDHKNWRGELPRREWIDAVTPENPVWVVRLDGHMGLANSLALELAGVDANSPEIDGGEIVRDPAGNSKGRLTGVLKDNAMRLVFSSVPEPSEARLDRFLQAAMHYVASNGVTTVHDVFADDFDSWTSLATYRRAERDGRLATRIYSVSPLPDWQRLAADVAANGRGSDWLKTGGVKGFMDGSLGSHTAAFLEPFTDAPDDRGFLINTTDDMRSWIQSADAAGLQVMVHAIGDRAIRDLLDIYAEVAGTAATAPAAPDSDRRLRMEHAQHIHPDDLGRFAAQGIIASMQPYHAIDDGRWAEAVIGPERARTTYAFESLIASGAHVAFGSDWYVAPATPLEGIYAAVTRRTLDDRNSDGWVPGQKITVEQALRAYTFEGAFASFDEHKKGRIEVGMLADLVLLDRDLTTIEPTMIREAQVLKTVVGGRIVFSQ